MGMSEKLLSREEFNRICLERDNGRCVFCNEPATEVHHIIDRKCFSDTGNYINNGASVCNDCHWKCETTEYSVEFVREKAGITNILLPEGFDPTKRYDKWGNILLKNGYRIKGPMFEDTAVQKLFKKELWMFFDCEDDLTL